jgi:ParB family chromosome partitioning protein
MAPMFQHVALSDIDPDDSPFVVTYRPQMELLQRSVARRGVLTPLHLRRLPGQTRLQVVCGSKRVQAGQEAACSRVPALIYEVTELADEQAFLLAMYDNLGCRVLNVVEKARLLWRLRQDFHYSIATLTAVCCPLLDLPPRSETVEAYCRLAGLDEALQAATVEGALPFETALWIGQHAAADRQALVGLFTSLKLSSSRAREFASLIEEICQRDACSATSLLAHLQMATLLSQPRLAGPQKIEQVRRLLRQVRYPRLSAHEQRFQESLRRLRLPSQISVQPPPYFEGQQFQVTFSFATRQELQQHAQRLLEAAAAPAMDDILALL